eukprot:2902320-Prymnesium_polylepis.1
MRLAYEVRPVGRGGSCAYHTIHGHAVKRAVVRQAMITLQAAPSRGIAHLATGGAFMDFSEAADWRSELVHPGSSNRLTWLRTRAEIPAYEGMQPVLPCDFEDDLSAFCFQRNFLTILTPYRVSRVR